MNIYCIHPSVKSNASTPTSNTSRNTLANYHNQATGSCARRLVFYQLGDTHTERDRDRDHRQAMQDAEACALGSWHYVGFGTYRARPLRGKDIIGVHICTAQDTGEARRARPLCFYDPSRLHAKAGRPSHACTWGARHHSRRCCYC